MTDQAADLKERVLEYLRASGKAKNRDVARALNEDKAAVDKAISELAKEDRIEFLYLGTSYVQAKDR
ncbi:MAG: hypothetical protein HYX92_03645 [Chloroflexi bacterium]|nr:hypothetical protein [Chloroflexota bacterium]